MKYVILITWFFFVACSKKGHIVMRPSEPIAQPANYIKIYQEEGSWYIEAKLSSPKLYDIGVLVETTHSDGETKSTFLLIRGGEIKSIMKIDNSYPVTSWVVGEWTKL